MVLTFEFVGRLSIRFRDSNKSAALLPDPTWLPHCSRSIVLLVLFPIFFCRDCVALISVPSTTKFAVCIVIVAMLLVSVTSRSTYKGQ